MDGPQDVLLSRLKNIVGPAGTRPRRVKTGALRGVRMELDLRDRTQVFLGLYERELHHWIRTLSERARSAIDVGAADGAYALYFLMRTGVRSVFAFESDPSALGRLGANLRLNGLDRDDRLHLLNAPVGTGRQGTVALDSLADRVETPCVVKVDVEGHEVDVLSGAEALLARRGVAWIIETHAVDLENECVRLLTSHSLLVRVVSPAWWRAAVPEHRPISHNRWLVATHVEPLT
jgi:hypothetical protein